MLKYVVTVCWRAAVAVAQGSKMLCVEWILVYLLGFNGVFDMLDTLEHGSRKLEIGLNESLDGWRIKG